MCIFFCCPYPEASITCTSVRFVVSNGHQTLTITLDCGLSGGRGQITAFIFFPSFLFFIDNTRFLFLINNIIRF